MTTKFLSAKEIIALLPIAQSTFYRAIVTAPDFPVASIIGNRRYWHPPFTSGSKGAKHEPHRTAGNECRWGDPWRFRGGRTSRQYRQGRSMGRRIHKMRPKAKVTGIYLRGKKPRCSHKDTLYRSPAKTSSPHPLHPLMQMPTVSKDIVALPTPETEIIVRCEIIEKRRDWINRNSEGAIETRDKGYSLVRFSIPSEAAAFIAKHIPDPMPAELLGTCGDGTGRPRIRRSEGAHGTANCISDRY